MNWRSIDLNLFVVFDAIVQERSITRAAARLHMSQSAVSHALARLRKALRDDLFVRTPEGMEPTAYAAGIAAPIQVTLDVFRDVLAQAAAFDAETADQVFRIAVDNRSALALAPLLAARIARQAPHVSLDLRPSGTLDLVERLERGELDLAIGNMADISNRLMQETLFDDGFVALVRRGHPAAQDGGITLEALAELPHLRLSSTGEDDDFVDAELTRHGLARHIALRAPLHSAAAILRDSAMVAIVGERTARAFAQAAALIEVLRLPMVTPRTTTAMLWHRRADSLAAHKWLRAAIRSAVEEM